MDNWELNKDQKSVLESAGNKLTEVTAELGEIDNKKSENEERFNDFE